MNTQRKKMVSFQLDVSIINRLEAWLEKQELPPTKTAVIEASLIAFLDRKEGGNAKSRR